MADDVEPLVVEAPPARSPWERRLARCAAEAPGLWTRWARASTPRVVAQAADRAGLDVDVVTAVGLDGIRSTFVRVRGDAAPVRAKAKALVLEDPPADAVRAGASRVDLQALARRAAELAAIGAAPVWPPPPAEEASPLDLDEPVDVLEALPPAPPFALPIIDRRTGWPAAHYRPGRVVCPLVDCLTSWPDEAAYRDHVAAGHPELVAEVECRFCGIGYPPGEVRAHEAECYSNPTAGE